ncbi:MAG TPA: hypothetical protein VGG17_03635 [Acidimicrobiales bacterium]
MHNKSIGTKVGRRVRSRIGSVVGIGVASMLVLAGVSLVGVLPASATAALTFSNVPASGIANQSLATFTVNIGSGGSSGDTVTVSSSDCTISGGTITGSTTGTTATFSSDVTITGGGSCILTATDTTAGGTATSSAISIAPTKLAFTSASPTAGLYSVPLPSFQVSVVGPTGNVDTAVSSDSIAISTATGGCTLTGTLSATTASGVATFSNVILTAGTACVLTATDSTNGSLATATTAAIAMSSNTPTQVGFKTQPTGTVTAGTASTYTVAVEASSGATVSSTTGDSDLITLTSVCKLSGVTAEYAVGGVATFPDLIINTAGACTLTATDSSRTLTAANSALVTVTPGVPTHLAFVTAPPTTVNGTGTALTTFEVGVEDAYGNIDSTVTGSTDTIVLSSPCGIGGTATESAAAGAAVFSNISYTGTGTCVLTATDTSRTLTVATATTSVGQPQAALSLTTRTGYIDSPLALGTKGGSGTGAVTYTVANGTATGCAITSGALKATTSGTCIVTATKAAASPYASVSTAATTVLISSAPRALHLAGILTIGRKSVVTISGYNFSGRPRAISNVAGFSATVSRDTGKLLTLKVTVKASATRPGVKTMTLIFANGKRSSFKYSLH